MENSLGTLLAPCPINLDVTVHLKFTSRCIRRATSNVRVQVGACLAGIDKNIGKVVAKSKQKYKIISDSVNIIDGYIINIGIDFKIVVYNNFNKKEVLDQCLQKAKDFFNIDKWYFNQPININQLEFFNSKWSR